MHATVIIIGFVLLAHSFRTYRQLYHPHVALTIILFVMFFSDFIVRGYSDPEIDYIPAGDIAAYQLIILIILTLSYMSYTFLFDKLRRRQIKISLPRALARAALVLATILFFLELYKRLSRSDYDFILAVELTFGPRFGRPWAQSGQFGGDDFITSLIGIVFPLSGLIFGILFFTFRRVLPKVGLALAWAAALAISIGDGSRTIFAITVAIPLAVFVSGNWPRRKAHALFGLLLGLNTIALGFSTMYSTRDYGLLDPNAPPVTLVYHQDNSYYMALKAAHIASISNERWDAIPFLTASILNFVPRAIWTGKPMLTEDFWGSYKPFFVTNSVIGEGFAMFGLFGGAIFSYLVIVGLASILRVTYMRLRNPLDLMAYLLICFYCYMILRSFLNVSMAIYMPALAMLLLLYSNRQERRATSA